jgi:hypothetical protein
MENEIANRPSGGKVTLVILIIIIFLFILYYTVMLLIGPSQKIVTINEEYNSKLTEKSNLDENIYSDSVYLKLLKEKAFLQSKIIMADADSIYLTINLSDSTANLEISGVVVHQVKMSDVHASKIITNGDENIIFSLLASPFTIENSFATIKKEPVMIKMAPKDTSEYKPDIVPDTSVTEPVNFILQMTNGLRIYVYQEEDEERMTQFKFDFKFRLIDTWNSIKSIAHFKIPEYHPYIKMRIPRADAKIIYRAIPRYGLVGIYL